MSEEDENISERLAGVARAFGGRRVVVVGDLVADQFVYGEISRVSREAPVMILRHERTETVPGGAANCAMNLASLGARAELIGIVGDDEAGRALLSKLRAAGVGCDGVVVSASMRTTTKVRILAGQAHSPRQQIVRVDYESGALSSSEQDETQEAIAGALRSAFAEADAVVVSDYNYGVAGDGVLELLRGELAGGGKPLLVDSRFRLGAFGGFTSATPNEDEVEQWAGVPLKSSEDLRAAGERLRSALGLRALLITRGKKGILLLEDGSAPLEMDSVGSHDAVDVTGAGDTVMAAYALALASGSTYADAARLANHAGGIVVLKRGTATVAAQELLASLRDNR